MKFPLFRRDRSKQAQLEAQEELERLMAASFRTLGQLLSRAADLIEAQRLSRSGFEKQGRFLQRLDGEAPAPPPKKND
jgi:hypothetical protein